MEQDLEYLPLLHLLQRRHGLDVGIGTDLAAHIELFERHTFLLSLLIA